RVSALVSADGEARDAAIASASHVISERLDSALKELRNVLARQDRRIAENVAAAVQRVTQPIATTIQDTLERLEGVNAEHASQLLQQVLSEFLQHFHERFGTQMTELGGLLAQTRELSEALHHSFAQSEARLDENAQALGKTILNAVA